jgi:hypothetical protein
MKIKMIFTLIFITLFILPINISSAAASPIQAGQIFWVGSSPLRDTTHLPPPSSNCDSYITPGLITVSASKTAPNNPVVVRQDPTHTGVNLTWFVEIQPTIYTYGIWQNIPYPNNGNCKSLNAECLINNSGQPCCTGYFCDPDNPNSGNGHCQYDPNYPPIWDCVDHSMDFREDIISLTAKAILTDASRNWILNDLSKVYPGTKLLHPEWSYRSTKSCKWEHDLCTWDYAVGSVQVMDPGWYDLVVSGITDGTDITPPREFSLVGGQFGVWLMQSSTTH